MGHGGGKDSLGFSTQFGVSLHSLVQEVGVQQRAPGVASGKEPGATPGCHSLVETSHGLCKGVTGSANVWLEEMILIILQLACLVQGTEMVQCPEPGYQHSNVEQHLVPPALLHCAPQPLVT